MHKILLSLFIFLALSISSLSAKDLDYSNNEDFTKMTDAINDFFNSTVNKIDDANDNNNDDVSSPIFKSSKYPKMDVQNKDNIYIYSFNLAGIEKKNIQLRIDDNDMLILEGTQEDKSKTTKDGYIKQEIFYGSFKRMVQLPKDADQSKLTTKYIDGILSVIIEKKSLSHTKSKLIPIN